MRPATIVLASVLSVALFGGAALADTYVCKDRKTGEVHFSNKKRVKGHRCKLFSKAPPSRKPVPEPQPVEPIATPQPSAAPTAPAPVVQTASRVPAPTQPSRVFIYPQGYPPATVHAPPPVYPVIEEHRPRLAPGDEPHERPGRERMYRAYVEEAADLYDLPDAFLMALVRVESDFRYRTRDRKRDALGLMGLSAEQARSLGVTDRFDPRASILGGARLVRRLANRHQGDLVRVLTAWHARDVEAEPGGAVMEQVRETLDHYYTYREAARLEAGSPR